MGLGGAATHFLVWQVIQLLLVISAGILIGVLLNASVRGIRWLLATGRAFALALGTRPARHPRRQRHRALSDKCELVSDRAWNARFMPPEDAIGPAKEKVPKRYHDQTWILNSQVMEGALGVPSDSDEAVIVVLDKNGNIVSQVHGMVTTARVSEITNALQTLSTD